MRNIPTFEQPLEIRIALHMAGKVLRLENARRFTEKLSAAKDMKTYISSFKNARHDYSFSEDFVTYTNELMAEIKPVLARAA